MNAAGVGKGLALGLTIGTVAIGALAIAYNAGRAGTPSVAVQPPPQTAVVAPPVAVPVAPPPPPAPLSPVAQATADVIEASMLFREMEEGERRDAMQSWGPVGDPSFASLERGTAAHIGARVCYRGTVLEIHDRPVGAELRISLSSYGDDAIYVIAATRPADDVVARTRVTVCGIVMGDFTYESQAGWNITLPLLGGVWVERRR